MMGLDIVTIGGVQIAAAGPPRIVAEIGNAHNGDLVRCLQLIEECHTAGADLVKFQCYTPDELVALRGGGPAPEPWGTDGWSMRDLYEKAQTPHDWFRGLDRFCKSIRMPWFSSVFGPQSLALLNRLGCPAYKLAALDIEADRVGHLALGIRSIPRAVMVASVRAPDGWADLLLHCPPGYPQTEGYDPRVAEGFSYHGTDWSVPADAIKHGAVLVECHVQRDAEPSELEANVSLTISQLAELCAFAKRGRTP